MNELVVTHNDLTDLPLKKFNASEIDILHTVCYEVKEKGVSEVIIPLSKIRKLSHFQSADQNRFIESVKNTNKKLLHLDFELESEDKTKIVQFALFPTFLIDKEEDTLKVKVNEPFAYLLNNFGKNYTSFELQQSAKLKSSYSKQIYKKLQGFKDTGVWIVLIEDFREYLDVPKSYRPSNIDQFIIKPSLNELSPIFEGLKCEKYYEKGGRGRPKVKGYKWTFKAEEDAKPVEPPTQEKVAEVTGWQKAHGFCPKCQRQIYQKKMENENGSWIMYGHPDFKTGDCSFWTNDSADLLQEHQLDVEPATEEQIENKKKLSSMLKNLFR